MKQFKASILATTILSFTLLTACGPDEEAATPPVKTEDEAALKVVTDFEADTLPSWVKASYADLSIVEGKSGKALRVDFDENAKQSGVIFTPETPWNWAQFGNVNLSMDIENNSEVSTHLFVTITDVTGKNQRRNVVLSTGEAGTYIAPITGPEVQLEAGLRANPSAFPEEANEMIWRFGNRETDMSQIASVAVEVFGAIRPKSITLDNLEIRKNPEPIKDYIVGLVDEFGQNAKVDFSRKIKTTQQLKEAADAELAALNPDGLPDRSRFGGWKDGPKFEATGYFRTQKVDGKWWMVDPEGYLFFSNGIANLRMANTTAVTGIDYRDPSVRVKNPNEVTPDDSKDPEIAPQAALDTAYVASDLRRNMFIWLPDYDDELAEHYSYRQSVFIGPTEHGETYSFYQANLERRYGEEYDHSYLDKWREVTLDRMKDWGFTSMGNWVDKGFHDNEKVPYFANGWIIGDFKTLSSGNDYWSPMPDAFDPEFKVRAQATISTIANEIQGTPWCVGVFIDNEKSWGDRDSLKGRYGIVMDGISKSAEESPAKAKFVEILKEKYAKIDDLNTVWGTDIESWDAFSAGYKIENLNEAMVPDLSALFTAFADQYFRVVHDTLEEAMPNHLYMGVRMASWGMPQEAVEAAIKYTDVMSYNVYKEGLQPKTWEFLEDLDKPSLIGEFHIGSLSDNGLYHPGLIEAPTQADRARMYKEYVQSVLDNPYMVGVHWFQYIDSPLVGRAYDGENYNVGFVTVTDQPYPEMVSAAKEVNTNLYPGRFGPAKK